jgi:hypothetical protein
MAKGLLGSEHLRGSAAKKLPVSNFFKGRLVRTLLFIVLTATLVGCFAPLQMQQLALTGCTGTTGAACSGGAADVLQANSSPPAWQDHPAAKTEKISPAKKANARHRRETNTRIQNARSHIVPKTVFHPDNGHRNNRATHRP